MENIIEDYFDLLSKNSHEIPKCLILLEVEQKKNDSINIQNYLYLPEGNCRTVKIKFCLSCIHIFYI